MNAALLLAVLPLMQMPEGVTVKDLYLRGSKIARSVEIRKVIDSRGSPMRYYTSRTKAFLGAGTLADIESWSLMDNTPVKAIYSYDRTKITADFRSGEVTFTKQEGLKRTVTKVSLPTDRPVLLSQFDPLVLTQNLKKDSVECAIVVPELQQVVNCKLAPEGPAPVYQGLEARQGTRFVLVGLQDRSWITLDQDGSFVKYKSESGLEARLDRWRDSDRLLFNLNL